MRHTKNEQIDGYYLKILNTAGFQWDQLPFYAPQQPVITRINTIVPTLTLVS